MALFKISKGASGGLSNQALGDGYCWFTYDDGKFYIDYKDPTDNVVKRKALNAEKADKDDLGNIIKNAYAASLNLAGHTLKLIAKDGTTVLSTITLPDELVKQTKKTDNAEYKILTTSSVSPTSGNAAEAAYDTGVTINPSTHTLTATKLKGILSTQDLKRPTGLRGLNDVTLQALINNTRANHLAFLPADQIIIEKTTDGGITWVDAGVSDATKLALFSEKRPNVTIPMLNGARSLLCGLRITITAMKYNVPDGTPETEKYNYWNSTYVKSSERYCQLKDMYFWLTAVNDSIGVTVQRATGANSNTWVNIFNDTSYFMTGWSGCNYINFSQSTFGGGTNQTGNYWNYRIILMTKGVNGTTTMATSSTTSAQSIMEIRGYGDTVWGVANNYMAYDHIYNFDANQNVTFPKQVTATKFIGPLQGNADTATKATQDGSGNVITSTYVKKAGDTMTGLLNLQANQYSDSYSGALNLNNSNIYGVNSIYTADLSDNAPEGFHFYRDATHVDTFYIKSGVPYFVANRELGTNGTSVPMARFSGTVTSGKVVVTDGTTGTVKAGTTSTATVIKTITFTAGEAPTTGDAIEADDITAWSAGTTPTLGTAISADDITEWSAGTLPTLGTAIPADDITAWNAGTSPSLTITTVNTDDITDWDAGSVTTAAVENGVLTITTGTVSSLSYTARSIGSASGWNAGTKPSLSYTAKSIPNVTGVGTLPSLSYTARTIPNVTSVGTAPSLTYTARSIPNITSVGTAPTLSTTTQTVVTGIS